MHAVINSAQSQALARLVHELHPTWDVPGIAAAISRAKNRGTVEALCIAAVRLAMRDDLKSPALLAADGPHWHTPGEALSGNYERCPEPGHTSFPAWNCSACRSEDLEHTHHPRETTEDRRDMYARGARTARAALATHQAMKHRDECERCGERDATRHDTGELLCRTCIREVEALT